MIASTEADALDPALGIESRRAYSVYVRARNQHASPITDTFFQLPRFVPFTQGQMCPRL